MPESQPLKYLDVSTSHVPTELVMDMIQGSAGDECHGFPTIACYREGAFLYVTDPELDAEDPPEIKPILELARKLGCTIVRIDADGEVRDDLPKYEWED